MSLAPLPPQPRAGTSSTEEIPLLRPRTSRRVVHTGNVAREMPAEPETGDTGPVDYVPRPPAAADDAAAKPSGRAARRPRIRTRPRSSTAVAGLGLGLASLALLEVGLLRHSGDHPAFWTAIPLWSAFATVAALLGLLVFAGGRRRRGSAGNDRAWKVSAAGLVGLSVFWVLTVLPVADTDRGLVLTAALGCLGVALAIAPGRTSG